jgi:hypothetical protein
MVYLIHRAAAGAKCQWVSWELVLAAHVVARACNPPALLSRGIFILQTFAAVLHLWRSTHPPELVAA